jgi:hypothetical protein
MRLQSADAHVALCTFFVLVREGALLRAARRAPRWTTRWYGRAWAVDFFLVSSSHGAPCPEAAEHLQHNGGQRLDARRHCQGGRRAGAFFSPSSLTCTRRTRTPRFCRARLTWGSCWGRAASARCTRASAAARTWRSSELFAVRRALSDASSRRRVFNIQNDPEELDNIRAVRERCACACVH